MSLASVQFCPVSIERIISGGQTGADRGALDAAIALGIPHGGYCPRGRRAEDGPIPERYRLRETMGESYLSRTEQNVKRSHGTVIFTLRPELSGGSARTADFARRHRKPWLHISLAGLPLEVAARKIRVLIGSSGAGILNVAGSRESSEPGIQARVTEVMACVLGSGEPG